MWKSVFDCVAGTSHQQTNLPCQDSCRVVHLQDGSEDLLIACCSDGAGSASRSADGSQIACDTFVDVVRDYYSIHNTSDLPAADEPHKWCNIVRSQIVEHASRLGVASRELACTFLAAVIGKCHATFLQIGDGAIATWDGSHYRTVFWPQSGEFANTTNFLTDDSYMDNLEVSQLHDQIDEFAMFTDGLERLILRFADKEVHAPFLSPLFAALRTSRDADRYFGPLRALLDSPEINSRTDDDKTLILATRIAELETSDALS